MNAKKIMGAVLVALLAAALFVGAAAATDFGTVFTYQNTAGASNELPDGVWTYGAATITVADHVVYPGVDFVAGTYKFGDHKVYVTYPTAAYAVGATIGDDDTPYLVANGGNVYAGSELDFNIKGANGFAVNNVYITYPNGTVANISGITTIEGGELTADKGVYKIQAIFATTGFVAGVPSNLLLDTVSALTFKVVGAEDATIAASVNKVYQGETVTITVKGTPGTTYLLNSTDVEINNNQLVVIDSEANGYGYEFVMPNVGEASFVATVTDDEEAIIALKYWNGSAYVAVKGKPEIKIAVAAPVVTAKLNAPAYFIGDEIELTGTSTAEATFTFNITGTNVAEFRVQADEFDAGKEWTANLTVGKKLDVGTYTIKVYQGTKVVATLPVALKQPFISIAEAPEVIAQNESATFLITAEAAEGVKAYFFGTNHFKATDAVAEKDDDDKVIPALFNVTLKKADTKKEVMATGQYFAVFQHPMYDGEFNIYEQNNGMIVLNATGSTTVVDLFNASTRQTANAAQALCDALDTQNIDDMYVKYSFFVVEKLEKDTFSMSEIPTEVVKGDKIVISGVDTASEKGTLVTVEMVSTAFAAVPKETVGSAAFIVVTTEIAEDGTWEVTLDTSDLNVDEYSLSVAIDSITEESVTVNVVEGSEPVTPTDEPTVVPTDEPVTPTEAPATPGFGALAALAGLGAVAVLLLRRE